jgi:signal recognition particle subunit SRP54
MFDTLSSKLQNAFKNLRGLGKISEENVGDSLREVRMALLEADVNFKVARDFIDRVKAKSLGQEVIQSIQPGTMNWWTCWARNIQGSNWLGPPRA